MVKLSLNFVDGRWDEANKFVVKADAVRTGSPSMQLHQAINNYP